MAPKKSVDATQAQIAKHEKKLNMPLVTDAELAAAQEQLNDKEELKRQHSKLTSYLKGQGIKKDFDHAPPAVRKKFFRAFVASRLAGMKEKGMDVAQTLESKKVGKVGWDWMNEEMMVIKRGANWTAEKLLVTEANLNHPNALQLKDATETNRWLKMYKVFND